MRADITSEYPGCWKDRVAAMSDNQVIAIYTRKLKDGSLQAKGGLEDRHRRHADLLTLEQPHWVEDRLKKLEKDMHNSIYFTDKIVLEDEQIKFDI